MPKNTCPINDPNKPICRYFLKKKCRHGDKCRFYHPPRITRTIEKKVKRTPGYCYCGSRLRTIMNYTAIRYGKEDQKRPLFFKVCGKTGRSMKKCLYGAPG